MRMYLGVQISHCKYCKVEIVWFDTAQNGRLPVYPERRKDGSLELVNGKLQRNNTRLDLYRSHLLDCKPLRDGLYRHNRIVLGAESACDKWEGCERIDRHYHCFKCGSTDHFANECEEETD